MDNKTQKTNLKEQLEWLYKNRKVHGKGYDSCFTNVHIDHPPKQELLKEYKFRPISDGQDKTACAKQFKEIGEQALKVLKGEIKSVVIKNTSVENLSVMDSNINFGNGFGRNEVISNSTRSNNASDTSQNRPKALEPSNFVNLCDLDDSPNATSGKTEIGNNSVSSQIQTTQPKIVYSPDIRSPQRNPQKIEQSNCANRISELEASILDIRKDLRKIREECDDAILVGEIPNSLINERSRLERLLSTRSLVLKNLKNDTYKAVATNQQATINCTEQGINQYSNILDVTNTQKNKCKCGKSTTVQTARSGNNIGRDYNRCEDCGFSSWVDSSDNRYSTGNISSASSEGAYANAVDLTSFQDENKKCNCGNNTFIQTVRSGDNAGREYNRCKDCGFSSWVNDERGSFSARSVQVSNDLVQPANPSQRMKQVYQTLRDVFGHKSFRQAQERVIKEALSGRDVFVLMPTGGGKSLCYQLPASVDNGVTVVVSPLVSLIQDQVQQLQALDVAVANLSGDQDYDEVQRPLIAELFSGSRIKLLYVTPEKIASSNMLSNLFENLSRRGLLARFVIDEAHCISQWGHDFRTDYLNLGKLRQSFKEIPIMALTATANHRTESDIIKSLKLSNPFVTRSSFNRPNLIYDIRPKLGKFMNEIAGFVKQRLNESGIIYCLSRTDCEKVSNQLHNLLEAKGTPLEKQISFYHAGLEPEDRAHRHHEWSKGKIKLIVATVAFGMGINKPDVRYVIHHTIPQSVTHYYQEAGRAGRDSEIAHCILYYAHKDKSRRQKLLMKDKETTKHHLHVHFDNLARMVAFCENEIECRRTLLLEYFGEKFDKEDCKRTCDNCKAMSTGNIAEKKDVTQDSLTLLNIVSRRQSQNLDITLIQALCVFLGHSGKLSPQLKTLPEFGVGKGKYTRPEVERILHHLILESYLGEKESKNSMGFTNTFLVEGKNAKRLKNGQSVSIIFRTRVKPQSDKKLSEKKATSSSSKKKKPSKNKVESHASEIVIENEVPDVEIIEHRPSNTNTTAARIPDYHVESLSQLLQDWRASICDNFDVMPYHILPNGGILAISKATPTTKEELSSIEGVGKARVNKYGESIIDIVKTYLHKNKLKPKPLSPISKSDQNNSTSATKSSGKSTGVRKSPYFSKPKQNSCPKLEDEFDELPEMDWQAIDHACETAMKSKGLSNTSTTKKNKNETDKVKESNWIQTKRTRLDNFDRFSYQNNK